MATLLFSAQVMLCFGKLASLFIASLRLYFLDNNYPMKSLSTLLKITLAFFQKYFFCYKLTARTFWLGLRRTHLKLVCAATSAG